MQVSLRRGTKRGFVVLVIDVEERNTVVVNDVWLGLSADAEPNGRARPLNALADEAVWPTVLGYRAIQVVVVRDPSGRRRASRCWTPRPPGMGVQRRWSCQPWDSWIAVRKTSHSTGSSARA